MTAKTTVGLKGVLPDEAVAGFLRGLQLKTGSGIGVPQGGDNISKVVDGAEGTIRMPWGEIKVKCESSVPKPTTPYSHMPGQEQPVVLEFKSTSMHRHRVDPMVSEIMAMIDQRGGYVTNTYLA